MDKNFEKYRQLIINFPQQFEKTLHMVKDFELNEKYDHLVICGMGASIWPAELLDLWLKSEGINSISIIRNYHLPYNLEKNTLIIIVSYSGNTEESLNIYQEAKNRKLPILAITSNGHLQDVCLNDNTSMLLSLPEGLIPRMATGYIFTILTEILIRTMPHLGSRDLILPHISAMAKNLHPESLEEKGKELAKKLKGKIPVIYTSENLKTIGFVWKIKFNENAKIQAFYNFFPELNHNEFSAYENPKNQNADMAVIILKDPKDDEKIIKRMDLTAKAIKDKGIEVEIIDLEGDNLLEKMFKSIILADWASLYLAQEYKIDPIATKLQEDFKKEIAK